MAFFIMTYKPAIATVADHENLRELWKLHGHTPVSLLGSVIVKKPLTARQRRRLPARLREMLVEGENDGI